MIVHAELNGRATGKLLLFGEHAAVYGHPALGISLPWTLELKILPVAEVRPAGSRRAIEPIPSLPGPFATMLSAPHLHAVVEVRSQVPIGLGFGSSAALCVAAERALTGASPSPSRSVAAVWRGAHEREKVFHGTPSGADTGLAARPGIGFLTWERGGGLPCYEPVPAAELHFVVAAVPRGSDTRAQVAAVAQRVRSGDSATRETLRRLGRYSADARGLLLEPGPPAARLGAVADHAQRLLAALGLSDPAQDRLLRDGRAAGASGGKLSGAGGGGALFLVCRDAATAARVLAAIGEQAAESAHVVFAAGSTRQRTPEPRQYTVGRWLHVPRQPSRTR